MAWEKEKFFLAVVGVFLFGMMLFLLGTAFGASTNSGDFKEMLLPVLSVIGSWVSGVGALGAVLVALWIAEKQKRNDKENLKIEFGFVIVPFASEAVLMVSVVAVGKQPSEINSIVIYGEGTTVSMYVSRLLNGSSPIPVNLGYGKKAMFFCEEGFEYHIGSYLNTYCGGKAKNLKICISTTTENFILVPDIKMKSTLESFAEKSGLAPERMQENG
ncbi:hypothetical protein Q7O60_16380 [Pseudomonas protegens]|uniref:hypothetical protein n=1 Tax=Pseudomonas protegens TaxID=380021 RepID=UPI002768A938|nr:hypothetical protein [Pseudomonas protegens]MDP9504575.1 hypothetical protein [Pseudomonas protegens]